MDIYIEKSSTTTAVARELAIEFGRVAILPLSYRISVADFFIFMGGIYRIYARLSRGSDGVSMRLPLFCLVGERRFFVRVDGKALRYGER